MDGFVFQIPAACQAKIPSHRNREPGPDSAFISTLEFSLPIRFPTGVQVIYVARSKDAPRMCAGRGRVGGLAVTAGILAGWWYLGRFHAFEDAVIGTSLGLVLVGVIDDLCDLKVRVRLVAQLFAIAVVILATGVYVHSLGILHGHDIELGWLGIPFTVVAVIGLLNAFNLIDGIDGLAGCMALVAAGAI